jgi:hypothetical protein
MSQLFFRRVTGYNMPISSCSALLIPSGNSYTVTISTFVGKIEAIGIVIDDITAQSINNIFRISINDVDVFNDALMSFIGFCGSDFSSPVFSRLAGSTYMHYHLKVNLDFENKIVIAYTNGAVGAKTINMCIHGRWGK